MAEQKLDIWAERRGEVALLIRQLTPEDALEVLARVVAECQDASTLAPLLIGTIRGMVERRGGQTDDS